MSSSIDLKKIPHSVLDQRSYAAGETIIAEGKAATEMFIVKTGRVSVRVGEIEVDEVGPGGILGEMALLDRTARSAEAVAIEATNVLPIDERVFIILVQETPGFALDVLRVLAGRLRRMNELATELDQSGA
jgi:CRP/FNR family cyclic AMP-dependent transcriptional regulator